MKDSYKIVLMKGFTERRKLGDKFHWYGAINF